MRACVRCGALRPAPAQLRGAVRLAQALQRVVPASRGSRGAGRRARLDQGCAARLSAAAAAAEGEPGPAVPQPEPAASRMVADAAPLVRQTRKRAPNVGELAEKTADGRPKPDPRTVAYLVQPGWFKTEEEVAQVLRSVPPRSRTRFPYDTAKATADWLRATLGPAPVKDGRCPAARAVKAFPYLLTRGASLQLKLDALTLPVEQGGVGCMLSEEQAREAFRKFPTIVGYAVDKLRSGWTLLTATEGGLGLTHEEARKCILLNPQVLHADFERFTKRVELLRSLGYADAHRMVLAASVVLNYKDETVIEHAGWWSRTGLDHVKILTTQPTLLGACSTTAYQAKLDFLRHVVGMSDADLNNAGLLFTLTLENRLRPRFFYAVTQGRLERFGISTMMQKKDSLFLAMMQGRPSTTKELASDVEVKRYQKLIASPSFVAWRERQEARMRKARLATP